MLAFEKEFFEFRDYYIENTHYRDQQVFIEDINQIKYRKKELCMLSDKRAYSYYSEFVHTYVKKQIGLDAQTLEENLEYVPIQVETYEPYVLTEPWCEYDKFLEIMQTDCLLKQPSEQEFVDWLDANCCSAWGKMNRHGEYYVGFWAYPEGSDERENAFQLSHQDNYQALIELPYPRKLIIRSVQLGCYNHHESPRYSHFVCWWFDQTIKKFGFLDTLEKWAIYNLNCRHIPLPTIYNDSGNDADSKNK